MKDYKKKALAQLKTMKKLIDSDDYKAAKKFIKFHQFATIVFAWSEPLSCYKTRISTPTRKNFEIELTFKIEINH